MRDSIIQMVDSANNEINHYSPDNLIHIDSTYPKIMDSDLRAGEPINQVVRFSPHIVIVAPIYEFIPFQ